MSRYLALCLLLLSILTSAFGQVPTSTMYGYVEDASGAGIPNATVRARNEGTGIEQSATTDSRGEFAFNAVPPGFYTVSVEAPSFKRLERSKVQLSPGDRIRVPLQLEVGSITERVTVTAEAALINTTTSEQRNTFNTLQLTDLPIPNRDWTALLALGTGVLKRGDGVSLNGFGSATFNFTVDGTNASGTQEYTGFGQFGGFNTIKAVSLEAIAEVQVSKGVAPAEIGNSLAGNVNVFTKSGTNQFHGSLFHNFRSSALNARNQFLTSKPRSVFNQFGGSIGGPIVRDRLFFFGVYEGYRDRSFSAFSGDVATPEFRAQAIAAVPAYKQFFDLFPLPTSAYAAGATTGFFEGSGSRRGNDNHVVARADYYLTPTSRLAARFTRSRPDSLAPALISANRLTFGGTSDVGTLNFVHSTASLTSETRFGVNNATTDRLFGVYVLDIPAISTTFGVGGAGSEIMAVKGRNYNLDEVVALNSGRHSLKFGTQYEIRRSGRENIELPSYTYSSLADFLGNIPSRVQYTFGLNDFRLSAWNLSFFVQDDFRVNRRLVLNLGLRYDYFSVPHERDNRLFNREEPFGLGALRNPDSIYNADKNNFAPRVGFAWTVDEAAKTVIRGGGGVFYNPHPLFSSGIEVVRNSVEVPFRSTFSRAEGIQYGLKYPLLNRDVLPIAAGQNALWSGSSLAINFPNPYSMQWSLGVQRQLNSSMSLESNYVGTRGVKLHFVREVNLVDRLTGLRPRTDFGQFRWYDTSESSHYHSWQNSLRKQFSQGLQFNVHYTWSRAISYRDADLLLGADRPQDPDNIRLERGPTPFDLTHVFSVDYVYRLPFGSSARSSMLVRALGGWELSGIFTASSGPVLNLVQTSAIPGARPDYIGGEPIRGDSRDTLQYLNPSAFRLVPVAAASGAPIRPGTLGRNALRGPSAWRWDAAIGKNFTLTERAVLQIRADMFNALNHTIFTGVNTSLNSATFGRLTSTAGPRTMQLNARLTF